MSQGNAFGSRVTPELLLKDIMILINLTCHHPCLFECFPFWLFFTPITKYKNQSNLLSLSSEGRVRKKGHQYGKKKKKLCLSIHFYSFIHAVNIYGGLTMPSVVVSTGLYWGKRQTGFPPYEIFICQQRGNGR